MDEFTKVKKRSRRRAEIHKYDEESPVFVQRAEKKLEVAKDVIDKSRQLVTFVETIAQGLPHVPDQRIFEIVCYGLGNFTRSPNSMYQYALALILSDYYDCRLHLYDPVFTDTEKLIMNKNSNVISENEVGRRKVKETTLFFLPHCPLELFENIVFTNWSERLSKCIIVGNNLKNVMDSRPDRVIKEKQPCLFNVFNHAEIFEVDNIFEYNDVFNDLAVHVFPEEKVMLLPLKSDFLV